MRRTMAPGMEPGSRVTGSGKPVAGRRSVAKASPTLTAVSFGASMTILVVLSRANGAPPPTVIDEGAGIRLTRGVARGAGPVGLAAGRHAVVIEARMTVEMSGLKVMR